MFVAAQVDRLVSFIFDSISAKSTNNKSITVYNGFANLFLSISYLFLNAITGAICSFIALLRNIVFYKYKNKLPIIVLFLYFAIIILLNIGQIHILIDIIPLVLVIIFGTALYYQNYLGLKIAGIITSFLEIIYDYYYHSYVGIATCTIYVILVTISLLKKKKKG